MHEKRGTYVIRKGADGGQLSHLSPGSCPNSLSPCCREGGGYTPHTPQGQTHPEWSPAPGETPGPFYYPHSQMIFLSVSAVSASIRLFISLPDSLALSSWVPTQPPELNIKLTMLLLFLRLFMAPHCVQDVVHTGPGSLLLTRYHLSPIIPQAIILLSDLLASQGSRTLSLYQVVPASLPEDTNESVDSSLCAWYFLDTLSLQGFNEWIFGAFL